ncbi:unnamed protein product [Linum tenue]|uniref:Cytochrome c oxidase subunit Vb n=1 Tax=Linum tenue TaxID=586396 RepID=A0AAV0K341_9ROSI|nr:unnamed protein product [Linum tenue]
MWRRVLPSPSSFSGRSATPGIAARFFSFASSQTPPSTTPFPVSSSPRTTTLFSSGIPIRVLQHLSTASWFVSFVFPPFINEIELASGKIPKAKVENVMPIATGHEREELQADLEGRNILEINYPVGPFGTKEAPAIVRSVYDKRIVGCPGGEAEDEHDVVWFWLEKGKPYNCPVCSQHFKLEVIGEGGSPDGHGDDH